MQIIVTVNIELIDCEVGACVESLSRISQSSRLISGLDFVYLMFMLESKHMSCSQSAALRCSHHPLAHTKLMR